MINADAAIVYIGNINDSVANLLKVSHLFSPFPAEFNNDSAFFDRMHYYLPGWEVPKLRSSLLTVKYGLITDCLAEFCKEMRKFDFTHLFEPFFSLNGEFNKRDEIAVRKTFSGLAKLLYPDKNIDKKGARLLLAYAVEGRRRVKEQLKIMAGVEFIDVNLGFIDSESGAETIIAVPEQNGGPLVPEVALKPGHIFAVGLGASNGETAVYKLENKIVPGEGKMETQGVRHDRAVKESIDAAWRYFTENGQKIAAGEDLYDYDYLLYYQDSQSKGLSDQISLAEFIALCSALSRRPVKESLVVAGDLKLSGTLNELKNIEDIFRVCKNAGARRILLPAEYTAETHALPRELLSRVEPVFYDNPVDAARKALKEQV